MRLWFLCLVLSSTVSIHVLACTKKIIDLSSKIANSRVTRLSTLEVEKGSLFDKYPELQEALKRWQNQFFHYELFIAQHLKKHRQFPTMMDAVIAFKKELDREVASLKQIVESIPETGHAIIPSIKNLQAMSDNIELKLLMMDRLPNSEMPVPVEGPIWPDKLKSMKTKNEFIVQATDHLAKEFIETKRVIGDRPELKRLQEVLLNLMPLKWKMKSFDKYWQVVKTHFTDSEMRRFKKVKELFQRPFNLKDETVMSYFESGFNSSFRAEVTEVYSALSTSGFLNHSIHFYKLRDSHPETLEFGIEYLSRLEERLRIAKDHIKKYGADEYLEKFPTLFTFGHDDIPGLELIDRVRLRMIYKEIDVVSRNSDGTYTWTEVKAQKNPKGSIGSSTKIKTYWQIRLMQEMLAFLDMQDQVKIVVSFPYGIAKSVKNSLVQKYGVTVRGAEI